MRLKFGFLALVAGIALVAAVTSATGAQKFGAARFRALHRRWEREGMTALWSAQSTSLRDQMQRGWGRIEIAELSHQYLQLTPLVGVA